MSWTTVFRQTYTVTAGTEPLLIPVTFEPYFRLVVNANLITGLGIREPILGTLRQQLIIPTLGEVKGQALTLSPSLQLFIPATEFPYQLVFQPVRRQFSFELTIHAELTAGAANSTDNTPVLAALANLQASIEALPTTGTGTDYTATLANIQASIEALPTTGTDDTSALAAIQASIEALDLEQSSVAAAFLSLGTGQTAIAAQLTNIQAAISTPSPAPPPTVALTFETNGDTNGLFYWLGTFYGQHNWINPQTLGTLTVVISSLASGSLSLLTNRVGASSLYSNSAPGQWVAFDLGAGKKLQPHHYALQHDNENGYYLRSWKLQGSNAIASNSLTDLANAAWTDLRVHTNDTTLNAPESWGSWDVVATLGYRWFRLVMTGLDANGGNYLLLGEVEFYGTFTRLQT